MREKEPSSIVSSKPDGSFVLVHPDGREEPYRAPATDRARIDAMTDDDIAEQIAADPDVAPEMTADWFDRAAVMRGDKVIRKGGRPKIAAPKKLVTLRLDPDVIQSFRATGAGWQSRMNAALRAALVGKTPGSKALRDLDGGNDLAVRSGAGKSLRSAASLTAKKSGEKGAKRAASVTKAGKAGKRRA